MIGFQSNFSIYFHPVQYGESVLSSQEEKEYSLFDLLLLTLFNNGSHFAWYHGGAYSFFLPFLFSPTRISFFIVATKRLYSLYQSSSCIGFSFRPSFQLLFGQRSPQGAMVPPYMRICSCFSLSRWSVHWSVQPLVGPSVRPPMHDAFVKKSRKIQCFSTMKPRDGHKKGRAYVKKNPRISLRGSVHRSVGPSVTTSIRSGNIYLFQ